MKKPSKDQSAKARAARLAKGLCPIHGLAFGQMDEYRPEVGQCPWMGGCEIKASQGETDHRKLRDLPPREWDWKLLDEYQSVLNGE